MRDSWNILTHRVANDKLNILDLDGLKIRETFSEFFSKIDRNMIKTQKSGLIYL